MIVRRKSNFDGVDKVRHHMSSAKTRSNVIQDVADYSFIF